MKRLFAASALVAVLLAPASFARASSTQTGGAQIQWTSAATSSLSIVTQYSTTPTQGLATPTLLPSAAGVCAGSGTEVAYTLTFGALTRNTAAPTACLYKNAIAIGVQTNDAAGFSVSEYLDAAPTTGIGICAFPNGGGSFPLAPAIAPVVASGRSGNPAAGTYTGQNLTSCAAGGNIVPQGAGGASSGGTVPGNPGTGGLEYYSPSTSGLSVMSMAGPTVNGGAIASFYGAEDVQVNLSPNASSSTAAQTGIFMTIELIAN
ncbi:MAG TPA: hypothetical protein VK665_14030 [Candidatus Elarobacter sp.]|nr:hypothetical protein [Candidatus Elarobacter sp.]